MGQIEKTFTDYFNKIEILASKLLPESIKTPTDAVYDSLCGFQSSIISYGEMMERHLESIRSCYDSMPANERESAVYYKERIEGLSSIINLIEEMCEDVYLISVTETNDRQEKIEIFKKHEGQVALLLRYGLLSVGDDENNVLFGQAMDILEEAENDTGNYYPVHIIQNQSNRRYLAKSEVDDTAIIIQGQIMYKKDFTLETVYRYRYLYPNIPIIISTWVDEVESDFRWRLEAIGVDILENVYPKESGEDHINYQLCNSLNGILYAKEHFSVKYALKCRSDQRFYLPGFINYLRNEIEMYPIKNGGKLSKRLVFQGSPNSMISFPFRITDFWAFGIIGDMLMLYSAPLSPNLDNRGTYKNVSSLVAYENDNFYKKLSENERIDHAKRLEGYLDCETYITRSFYERCILERTLCAEKDDIMLHFWEYIRNNIIIEDQETLLMYWNKYTWPRYNYDCCTYDGTLSHSTWLDIYLHGDDLLGQ